MSRRFASALAVCALAAAVACALGDAPLAAAERVLPERGAPPVLHRTVLSSEYEIDRKYRSMQGPYSLEEVYLLDGTADAALVPEGEPELLWIVGYETRVVDTADGSEVSQEFMCHANLDFEPVEYMKAFRMRHGVSGRVFTLSQGQQEIQFPPGFGIPILSNQSLRLTTQVLNLNLEHPDLEVRHRVRIDFVRDRDVPRDRPMTPLYQKAVEGFKSLEDEGMHYGLDSSVADAAVHGAGCAIGRSAIGGDADLDPLGRKFTAHWVVEPGREVTRTLVTKFLNLPFDTTAHYIAVHLHPFAESLELIDRTTGETIFRADVEPAPGRIGIERVEHLASAEGIPFFKDHEYELVSVYDNTSGEEQDSMAVMYLYLHDRNFQRPR